jgi:hypothetical protein
MKGNVDMSGKSDREILLEIHAQVHTIGSRVDDHHADLYGNGQPGMKHRLTVLETEHRACVACAGAAKMARAAWWKHPATVGAGSGGIILGLVELAKAAVQHFASKGG